MKTVRLPSGERVPAYGQGTWLIGEKRTRRAEEIATLRHGLDRGATLIDTAEMYGDGAAEELIAEAIAGRRDEAFIVSKVYPHNATRRGAVAACERSLKRLKTDRIDLYLLHWRGSVPLEETLEAFGALQAAGKIRYWGVSNFDLDDMQELDSVRAACGDSGVEARHAVATNQVLYNLTRRGIEFALLPWMRERQIPVMAYSPIEQGRLLANRKLTAFSREHGITPAQAALAWLLSKDDVIAIPKCSSTERLDENLHALEITLTREQLRALDEVFPPPKKKVPLEML